MAAWFQADRAPAWRRIIAYLVDCLLIDAYLLLVSAAAWIAQRAGASPWEPTGSAAINQLITIAVLTGPATLYLAWSEASRRQATVGKRLLGLRVVGADGGRPSPGHTAWRAVLKLFLPWEAAHVVVQRVGLRLRAAMDVQQVDLAAAWRDVRLTPLELALLVILGAVLAAYVLTLFTPSGRTLYDRATRTRVVTA